MLDDIENFFHRPWPDGLASTVGWCLLSLLVLILVKTARHLRSHPLAYMLRTAVWPRPYTALEAKLLAAASHHAWWQLYNDTHLVWRSAIESRWLVGCGWNTEHLELEELSGPSGFGTWRATPLDGLVRPSVGRRMVGLLHAHYRRLCQQKRRAELDSRRQRLEGIASRLPGPPAQQG